MFLSNSIKYQYDNHLGSASLELDENAQIITYEEYHPFGTTSFRAGRSLIETSLKRYKYIGKERDDETGLYYYGARYYAAWLCRFVSVDPLAGKFPFYSPYQYSGNNPVTFYDLDGNEQVDNTKTNVEQNGQQNKLSFKQEKPNLDDEGNVVSKTKEETSVTQNEDGSFTLNHEKGLQFTDSKDRKYERYTENFESPEFLSEKGKSLVNNLFENLAKNNIKQTPTISGSPTPVEIPSAGNVKKSVDLKTHERANTSVGIASDVIEGAAESSRADYLSKSKELAKKGYKIFDRETQAFKFFGKVAKFARGLGIVTGVLQMYFSGNRIVETLQDPNQNIDPWDVIDFTVASLAVAASVLLMFTPVGWFAAAAYIAAAIATTYFTGRLIEDLITN